jgi:hypothetical protein
MKFLGTMAGVSVVLLGSVGSASAINPIVQQQRRAETRVMAGVQWNFGTSTPEFVVGVRRIETRRGDSTFGGKFDIAIPLSMKNFKTPIVRVMALAGNRDIQAEFGFGVKLLEWKAVAGLGVQAPYTNGGVNYIFGDGLNPYLGINTLARPNAPTTTGVIITPPPQPPPPP